MKYTPFVLGVLMISVARTADAQQPQVARGAEVYGDACGTCHNARSPLERTDRQWSTIANHMRVRGNLTGGQLRAVRAFLQATNGDPRQVTRLSEDALAREMETLQFSTDISTDPDMISGGLALATQKACVGCHVIGREGGNVGPELNSVIARRGAAYIRHKLTDPTFDNESSMMPNFGLSEQEIDALVAYINSVQR